MSKFISCLHLINILFVMDSLRPNDIIEIKQMDVRCTLDKKKKSAKGTSDPETRMDVRKRFIGIKRRVWSRPNSWSILSFHQMAYPNVRNLKVWLVIVTKRQVWINVIYIVTSLWLKKVDQIFIIKLYNLFIRLYVVTIPTCKHIFL